MKLKTAGAGLLLLTATALAIDVNPARQSVPEKFLNPPGKRFSIFSGDPERVQKANEINIADFKATTLVEPATISKAAAADASKAPLMLRITFRVKNTAKRSYTLSFPDSERYDVAVSQGKDNMVYLWSQDKQFEQVSGSCFINAGESISYTLEIPANAIAPSAAPGVYDVKVILANYPEATATAPLTITP